MMPAVTFMENCLHLVSGKHKTSLMKQTLSQSTLNLRLQQALLPLKISFFTKKIIIQ
jgi:hypothetical protein